MTMLSQKAFENARKTGRFDVSFELFPARTPGDQERMKTVAAELGTYSPSFMTVTYGAGGSTRTATLDSVKAMGSATNRPVAGHLTCVGASKDDTNAVARRYRELGVGRVVALRGDPPMGHTGYAAHPHGYQSTADLVGHLKQALGFDVSVAAYPEVHPDSTSPKSDIDNLRRKLDAGADRAITQFFFDNRTYFQLLDRCAASGIDKPIVPGILLIHDFGNVCNFARKCGAAVPEWLQARFAGLDNNPAAQQLAAVSVAAEQVLELADQGVQQFHFYTLNRPDLAAAVCRCLGIVPQARLEAAA